MKIKNVLISQPKPSGGRSPYEDLKEKYKVKIDFRPFIMVKGVSSKEFRKQRIDILAHSAIIMTSRTAIENFFRLCEELRVDVPANMKYFCKTEAIALYLQKFITYRKRKVFFPKNKKKTLEDLFIKHKKEKFMVPRSDVSSKSISNFLKKNKIEYTEAVMYKTISCDLSDLKEMNYDVLAFFSPSGIKSLTENFPDFSQNNTKIAAFGNATCEAVKKAGLSLDIKAPTPQAPSMKMALEQFIKKNGGK